VVDNNLLFANTDRIGLSDFEAQAPIAPPVHNNIRTATLRSDDSKPLVLLFLLLHLALFWISSAFVWPIGLLPPLLLVL
jgi:hypothetical protein